MKRKKAFGTGMAFSVFVVAVMVSSATAIPVLNLINNPEIETNSEMNPIEINSETEPHTEEVPELNDRPEEGQLGLGEATFNINVKKKENWFGEYLPFSGADVFAMPFWGFGIYRLIYAYLLATEQHAVTDDNGNCEIKVVAPPEPYHFPYIVLVVDNGWIEGNIKIIGSAVEMETCADKTYNVEIKCRCQWFELSEAEQVVVEQSIVEESETVLVNQQNSQNNNC